MAPQQQQQQQLAVRRHACFVLTPESAPSFDMATYSRFKYGHVGATAGYAALLADTLDELFPQGGPERPRLVVAPSAYVALPTAAAVLTTRMLETLDDTGRHAPESVGIGRESHIDKDFSLLTPEQRASVMAANSLELPPAAALAGRHLVVVDDCRITGAHEGNVVRAIEEAGGAGLAGVTFLYLAMVPQEIVAAAKAGSPDEAAFLKSIEGSMNGAAVSCLADLAPILSAPTAELTARAAKFVLQRATVEGAPALANLLAALPRRVVAKLAEGVDADGYSSMPSLAGAAAELKRMAEAKLGAERAAAAAAAAMVRRSSGSWSLASFLEGRSGSLRSASMTAPIMLVRAPSRPLRAA